MTEKNRLQNSLRIAQEAYTNAQNRGDFQAYQELRAQWNALYAKYLKF